MKISTNQAGNAIDRGRWKTRNIMPAKARQIARPLRTEALRSPYCTDLRHRRNCVCHLDSPIRVARTT
jgi:hypothetical protein